MKVTLALYHLTNKIAELVVESFPLLIGRSDQADITLDDRWVSRRHCQLEARHGVLVVRDLNSKHGIVVNDVHVKQSPLLPGDTLGVGLTRLVASYEHEALQDRLEAVCDP